MYNSIQCVTYYLQINYLTELQVRVVNDRRLRGAVGGAAIWLRPLRFIVIYSNVGPSSIFIPEIIYLINRYKALIQNKLN